jgi:hypothetical protein
MLMWQPSRRAGSTDSRLWVSAAPHPNRVIRAGVLCGSVRIGLPTVGDRHMTAALTSWREGRAKQAIVDFVASVRQDGPRFIAAADWIAAFDNDAATPASGMLFI